MAQKEKQQKGVWPMCASGGGGGNPLSVYVFFLALLLLSLTHTTHGGIECRATKRERGIIQPQKSVDDAVKDTRTSMQESQNSFCFIVYNLDGQDPKPETKWNLTHHHYTYVAGGSSHPITVCNTSPNWGGCKIENTTEGDAWRLDFACCCRSNSRDGCNAEGSVDPQYQFKVQLEQSNNQICRVDYAKDKRINDCSRLSGQKETAATPSRCWSVLKGDDWELGCALDNDGTDRCSWAAKYTEVKSGVCRLNAKKNVECCCLGKYCNGEAYMNLTCRAETKQWSSHWNFTYGVPGCGVAWPKKTTPSPITANPDNTTTTGGSSTLLIVGLIVGVIVLLLICIVVAVGIFVYCKKKRRKGKGSKVYRALTEDEIGVRADVGKTMFHSGGIAFKKEDCPLLRYDIAAPSVCEADDCVPFHSHGDTGFLGTTHYGGYMGNLYILKRYSNEVTKGRKFQQGGMLEKYKGLENLNLLKVIDIQLPATKPTPTPLLIVSESALKSNPLKLFQMRAIYDPESEGEYHANMFPVNYCMAAQVTKAVAYLNSQKITCYNIKPNNIIVFTTVDPCMQCFNMSQKQFERMEMEHSFPMIKLTDFVYPEILVEYVQRDKEKAWALGNPEYYPPEARTKYDFNQHTQSYMCAMVMIEMWDWEKKPFANEERSSLFGQGKKAGETPPLPECIPKGAYIELLIKRMMSKEPTKRPWPYEAAHVLSHIFVNYTEERFGSKASFESPATTWAEMSPNEESIRPGPIPTGALPQLPFGLDKEDAAGAGEPKKDANVVSQGQASTQSSTGTGTGGSDSNVKTQ